MSAVSGCFQDHVADMESSRRRGPVPRVPDIHETAIRGQGIQSFGPCFAGSREHDRIVPAGSPDIVECNIVGARYAATAIHVARARFPAGVIAIPVTGPAIILGISGAPVVACGAPIFHFRRSIFCDGICQFCTALHIGFRWSQFYHERLGASVAYMGTCARIYHTRPVSVNTSHNIGFVG